MGDRCHGHSVVCASLSETGGDKMRECAGISERDKSGNERRLGGNGRDLAQL